MKYPPIHAMRRKRAHYRNAAEYQVSTRGDFIKMRLDQLRQFRKLRGTFKTRTILPKRPPYGNGAAPNQSIPRTTNGDIKAIVRAWDRAFQAYGPRAQRLGGSHNKAFEQTHRRRWAHTKQLVTQYTQTQPDRAAFSHNAVFWTIWLNDLATYLSVRQQGQPARMDIIAEVLDQAIDELPDTLIDATETALDHASNAAQATADAAAAGIDTAKGWLKWAALAGATLLVAPLALRGWHRRQP